VCIHIRALEPKVGIESLLRLICSGRVCYAKECEEARECAALKGRRNSASQSCYVRNVATYDLREMPLPSRIPFISTFTDPGTLRSFSCE